MSGLTLGLLSVEDAPLSQRIILRGLSTELRKELELSIVQRCGSSAEKRMATKVRNLVKRKHLLLVTLLLCNAVAMEALPLVLDRILSPIGSVLISVTAVLAFGEILPQAFCKAYGLAAGAAASPLVQCLLVVCWPIAWPISKLLDCVLGHDHGNFLNQEEMAAAVEIHREKGHLSPEEADIMQGALSMARKKCQDGMTPLERVNCLPSNAVLDAATMNWIMTSGHSRIPVYEAGRPNKFIGFILVKKLIGLRCEDAWPVATQRLSPLVLVHEDEPLYKVLDIFQTGHTHMALVYPGGTDLGSNVVPEDTRPLGILTLEDVLEELINEEIVDETDRFIDAAHGKGSAEKLRVSSGDVGVYTSPAPYVPAMPGNMSLRRQATDPGFRRLRITTMCEMAQGRKSVRQQTVRTAGRPQQLRVQTTQQSIQESSEDASASSSSE
ncbi:CBSDUF5 [Symbiodinium natans]|uniref:CBSDUF5 protein n=1 Tax=Symbiodinium natans TaxID=878477 RepID=A0A812TYI9_9DINO|nr:CBSDUF5 [Symbiodinium natans]